MVDVPAIPNIVPELRAPVSRYSPGQIAGPYQELAANLTKAGEVAERDIAVPAAERAGEQAVSPDGKTVTPSAIPILGAATSAFARAARFTALNRMTPEIENRMAEIRLEHANDPQGFQQAAKAFRDTYINGSDQTPGITDPALKGPVEKTINHVAGTGYRSVLEQTDQTNIQNLLTTSQKRLTEINDESASLARQG